MFITLEGPEASGKSTIQKLLYRRFSEKGYPVLTNREPGGSSLGDQIRAVLMDNEAIDGRIQVALFAASIGHNSRWIEAQRGTRLILSDRWYDSTLALQPTFHNIPQQEVREIYRLVKAAVPDLTIYLDVPPEVLFRRLIDKPDKNHMDTEFGSYKGLRATRGAYLGLIAQEPHRWKIVDGDRDSELIADDIERIVTERLHQSERDPRSPSPRA